MGALSQTEFDRIVNAGCSACGAATLEISSFIDRSVVVMLAEPNDAGKWVHDGEKFVDGTHRIACTVCAHVVFASDMCPRCNTAGALSRATHEATRLAVPKRCPKCNELELLAVALVSARAQYGAGRPKAQPAAELGEPGYHVVAFACPACDNAVVAERCPLCDAAGPLRPRP